ncbi:MAG: hypothetical protein NWE89_05550 [Candidatus Bathyarchaeota archaeon]|nr:hypothetical protein [Candidatus Bathyarchaeota archaeon]
MIGKETVCEIVRIVLERYAVREELSQEEFNEMIMEIQELFPPSEYRTPLFFVNFKR